MSESRRGDAIAAVLAAAASAGIVGILVGAGVLAVAAAAVVGVLGALAVEAVVGARPEPAPGSPAPRPGATVTERVPAAADAPTGRVTPAPTERTTPAPTERIAPAPARSPDATRPVGAAAVGAAGAAGDVDGAPQEPTTVDLAPWRGRRWERGGQCPRCGGWAVAARSDGDWYRFGCSRCAFGWRWRPGYAWPATLVRPDVGRDIAATTSPDGGDRDG